MKPSERDELLIRLDERTANIYKLSEKQEKHLSELNEQVGKNVLNIDRNHNRLTDVEGNIAGGVSLKLSKKQITTGSVSIGTILLMLAIAAGKILGWW